MRTVLEPEDIQAIADAVAARLSATIPTNTVAKDQEEIFDVPGLATYLKVDNSWVYKQDQYKTIPHFHAGRYPSSRSKRFRDAEALLIERKHQVQQGHQPEMIRIQNHTLRELATRYKEFCQLQRG